MRQTIIATTLLLLMGCASTKTIVGTDQHHDSTRVEARTEYIERIDTVFVQIEQSEQTVILQDTTSILENKYCTSFARVTTDGELMHDLKTKKEKIPVQTVTKEVVRDSIVYRDNIVYVEKPVEVVKPKSTFEKVEIHGFWILLTALLIFFIIKLK